MAHDSIDERASPEDAAAAVGVCEIPGWGRFVLAWKADALILLGLPDRAPGEYLGRLAARGVIVRCTSGVPENFRRALADYCDGDPDAFAGLRTAQPATPFQQRVWDALRAVPVGELRTYGAIARAVGQPEAVRAVGNACAANLVGLVVPCHRVVGQGGSLGGFAAGAAWKRRLLDHEARIRARRASA